MRFFWIGRLVCNLEFEIRSTPVLGDSKDFCRINRAESRDGSLRGLALAHILTSAIACTAMDYEYDKARNSG